MQRRRGFTLVELLVVLAIIGTLVALVAPRFTGSVDQARDTVLRQNLDTLRGAIDKHYADTGRYPDHLQDLVTRRYLRRLPADPVTESTTSWIVVAPALAEQGGVFDVKSGARGQARDGTVYRDW